MSIAGKCVFFLTIRQPPNSKLFPYTTLFRSVGVRKDGRRVDVSVTVSPIRGARGRIVGASLIARDITHRKEAEAAGRRRDILRYVAGLAAAAAHEINNPLAAAMGHTCLLADQADANGR